MTPDQTGIAIANRFLLIRLDSFDVSGEYTGRDDLAIHIASAIRQAYEDAARIAEGYEGWVDNDFVAHIAAAIRACATPRNTTPTDDHSKE
jgi:hypothetical protein